jgi:hypothetical protein
MSPEPLGYGVRYAEPDPDGEEAGTGDCGTGDKGAGVCGIGDIAPDG